MNTAATKAVGAGAQILLLRREPYQSADQPILQRLVESLVQIPTVELSLAAVVQNRMLSGPTDLADFQRRLSLPGALTTELMHYLRF